jgi:hypothetical protein
MGLLAPLLAPLGCCAAKDLAKLDDVGNSVAELHEEYFDEGETYDLAEE